MSTPASTLETGNTIYQRLLSKALTVKQPHHYEVYAGHRHRTPGKRASEKTTSATISDTHAPTHTLAPAPNQTPASSSQPSPAPSPAFYSRLVQVIEEKMPRRTTPAQLLGLLSKAQISRDELRWSGLERWLGAQVEAAQTEAVQVEAVQAEGGENIRITREQVLEFLATHGVQLSETRHDDGHEERLRAAIDAQEFAFHCFNAFDEDLRQRYAHSDEWTPAEVAKRNRLSEEYGEASRALLPLQRGEGAPKFADYVLPGGSDYRELLIHWAPPDPFTRYQSKHWDEPNVLAHARYNYRPDASGQDVLFIEELQSDWHQDARAGKNVDPAPFARTWHELLLRRLLHQAVMDGCTAIAWTTGDQQAERYSLDQRIDALEWKRNARGRFDIHIYKNQRVIWKQADTEPEKMEELMGREMALKIVYSPDDKGLMQGDDLKFGNRGMCGFYDAIVPQYLKKYARAWGVTPTTGEVSVSNSDDDTVLVRLLPIPENMAHDILVNGQPLFKALSQVLFWKQS